MIIVTAIDEENGHEVYAFHCESDLIATYLEGALLACGLNVTVQAHSVRTIGSEDEIDQAVDDMVAAARGMTKREEAWAAVVPRLPSGWRITGPTYDPAMRSWEVEAHSPTPGRLSRKRAASIIGVGSDEAAALLDLAEQLAARA
jgi:hypothetical protein